MYAVTSPSDDDATPVNVSPSGKNAVLSVVLPNVICVGVGTSIDFCKFLLQTKTSGCAALLSFPEFALPGVNTQPELVAITFSFA